MLSVANGQAPIQRRIPKPTVHHAMSVEDFNAKPLDKRSNWSRIWEKLWRQGQPEDIVAEVTLGRPLSASVLDWPLSLIGHDHTYSNPHQANRDQLRGT